MVLNFLFAAQKRLMKSLGGNVCPLCFGMKKTQKPWRQSDFIINNSAFIGRVIHSGVTFRNSISNWQTGEIFLISWTISLWCIHYKATVTSLITWNNVRAIPETAPLAIHGKLLAVSLRFRHDFAPPKWQYEWWLVKCFMFPLSCYYRPNPLPIHPRTPGLFFSVCPLVSHATITPPSVALVQRRVYFLPTGNLLEIKRMGREGC